MSADRCLSRAGRAWPGRRGACPLWLPLLAIACTVPRPARAQPVPPGAGGSESLDYGYQQEEWLTELELVSPHALEVFHEELSPHGDWVDVQPYGPVWRPSEAVVGSGFRPYVTGGRWVYTVDGWVFESDWDWGWAVYHYGRWAYVEHYGWIWVPGTRWAPSWCLWRETDAYVGWAPLPPPGLVVHVRARPAYWTFVPWTGFLTVNLQRHIVPSIRLFPVFHTSRAIFTARAFRGYRYIAGPPVGRVETVTRYRVPRRTVVPPRQGTIGTAYLRERPGAPGYRLHGWRRDTQRDRRWRVPPPVERRIAPPRETVPRRDPRLRPPVQRRPAPPRGYQAPPPVERRPAPPPRTGPRHRDQRPAPPAQRPAPPVQRRPAPPRSVRPTSSAAPLTAARAPGGGLFGVS